MDDTTLCCLARPLRPLGPPEDAQRQLFRQLEQRTRLSPPWTAIGLPAASLRAEPLPPERHITAALGSLRRAEHANGLHLFAV